MSAYPTLPQGRDSAQADMLGRQSDRASNGAMRMRSFFSSTKKEWTLTHTRLSTAERTTLEAHYAAHANISFTFVYAGDGATYTVYYGPDDWKWVPVSFQLWSVVVKLVQA